MFCSSCGKPNADASSFCTNCGQPLRPPPPAPAPYAYPPPAGPYPYYQQPYPYPPVNQDVDQALGVILPLKNPKAIGAYYCGLFGLIPMIGLPLGLAGLIMGISALAIARREPYRRGKVHAWVGIVLGGFSTLVHGAVVAYWVFWSYR